ncbi:MAG: MlaD family protein [Caulobacterales bacterium]|jgi:phospholipid/cholesterol/gamma-HCH transport system substrate-binding protein
METRANYVLLGGAAIVGAALIMLFAMWLARASWSTQYSMYEVVFEGAVRGLSNGGEVRFNGIKVGEVEELTIDPRNANRVLALVRVRATTPVKVDTLGQLEQIGLTGVTLIQLSGGTPSAPILRQGLGQPVPQIRGLPDPLAEIFMAGEDIATRASETLAAAQGLFTEENIDAVSKMLRDLSAVSSELAANRAAIADAAAAARAIREGSEAVSVLATDAQGRLANLDARSSAVLEETQVAVSNLNVAVLSARDLMTELEDTATTVNAQTLPEMTLAAQDIRRLSVALERLAGEVEEDPYGFVFDQSRPTVEVRP